MALLFGASLTTFLVGSVADATMRVAVLEHRVQNRHPHELFKFNFGATWNAWDFPALPQSEAAPGNPPEMFEGPLQL